MSAHSATPTLFQPGRNCWRVEKAQRAAFLVDGDIYFRCFVEAARKAKRSILITGWDFHSRTRLLCSDPQHCNLELGEFLNHLVRNNRHLHIHILIWDYPMIFGLNREWGPFYGLGWQPHRRVHFRYDNTHPIGGSHHQKIVVIDDAVAFNGGIDLTCRRWDTAEHSPTNEHRVVKGDGYPPFHDLMMAVEGDVARALGDVVRDRWHKATGETLRPPASQRRRMFRRKSAAAEMEGSRWPDSLPANVSNVEVGVSLTEPAINGSTGVREVEALYFDMIAAAKHSIYIENQYFTADKVGEALAARLAEPDGPEIIVVLRELSHGWLEELTMQTLRTRLIEKLRAADQYDRLRVFYPFIAGLQEGTCIDVHSKMIVIDDDIMRIGSANLANRSMGLDTECDLTIEARGRQDVREQICNLRSLLLAEHLGAAVAEVSKAVATAGNLRDAIETLHREDRTLQPLTELPQVSEALLNVISVADPEKPVALSDLALIFSSSAETSVASEDVHAVAVNDSEPMDARSIRRGPSWGKLAAIAAVFIGLTALWQFTPLAQYLDGNRITGWARDVGREWWVPVLTVLAFTPASYVMFPRPLITLFAVIAFGPIWGFVCAMLGIQLAAWSNYVVGQLLDPSTVRRMAGAKLERILQVLRRRGLLAMTALRLVPLAPFAVEGFVAGAIRMRLWQFMLGTALGILPGTLTSTVFGDQLQVWMEDPDRINYWLIACVLFLLGGATWFVRRWLMSAAATSPRHGPRHGVSDAPAS